MFDVDAMEKRYEDQATDIGEKSPTSPPFYFCCDLILGNSCGMEGSYGFEFIKDQRPFQMVTVDGREWGLIVSPGGGRIQEEEASPWFVEAWVFPVGKIAP